MGKELFPNVYDLLSVLISTDNRSYTFGNSSFPIIYFPHLSELTVLRPLPFPADR